MNFHNIIIKIYIYIYIYIIFEISSNADCQILCFMDFVSNLLFNYFKLDWRFYAQQINVFQF